LVGLLALTAGCAGFLASDIDDETLDERPPQPYDWNTTADVTVTVVESGSYQAVYDLDNTTTVRLYERGLSTDQPLSVRSVRYRYPDGRVINGSDSAITVTQEGSRRVIEVPDAGGQLAYTTEAGAKEVGAPAYVGGSYEVILPPDHRVGDFLFSQVNPGGHEVDGPDAQNRLHVTWDEIEEGNGWFVRYYLARDVLIFRGLVVALAVVGGGGLLYYLRKIRALEDRREEAGLEVDTDDDDFGGGGGPPGFR
jgi:hypothetical protein